MASLGREQVEEEEQSTDYGMMAGTAVTSTLN
jgi:hypothetical protein